MNLLGCDRPLQHSTHHLDFDIERSNYLEAEQQFKQLLKAENLDRLVAAHPSRVEPLEKAIEAALAIAYSEANLETRSRTEVLIDRQAAHQFLQRILYHFNRLNFFWYGELKQYQNERSLYLQQLRDRIEFVWQAWEVAQLDVEQLKQVDIKHALLERAEADLARPLSDSDRYIREDMTLDGYRHLIAIASLDGLVESSRLCHILGGASHEVQATLVRVLMEEYGGGRLNRKHSTFFASMMEDLGLDSQPETYLDYVPWEVLACINHNFLLTNRKRHYLRYNGGFTYFEIVGPSVYKNYVAAAKRLELSETARAYWELHIREDERHGQWMLHNVALPLADYYPDDAWELLLGYDQDKLMGDRAGQAVLKTVRVAEQLAVQ